MKKVVSINIGGRLIPIDDTALEALTAYLEHLRHKHSDDLGQAAIIKDIESRMSEIMSERLAKGSPSISDSDISEIIEFINKPKLESPDGPANESPISPHDKKNLYRNTDDKLLGGVCSGLAHYFNIDPSIIRVIFAVSFFAFWGIILYGVLWVVVPERKLGAFTGKRFYRDSKNAALGGVASGIAHYFKWDVKIVRLIFLAPIILGVVFSFLSWPFFFAGFWFPRIMFHSSLTGTFVLAYIFLWILLPPLENRSENNPEKKIKKTGADQVQNPSVSTIGHSIGLLARIFVFFVLGIVVFSMFVALVAIFIVGGALWPLNDFLWTSDWQQYYAFGTLVLFLFLPFVSLIIWIIRKIIGARRGSLFLGGSFGILWTVGWVFLILLVSSLLKEARFYEHTAPRPIPITVQPKDNRLTITVSQPRLSSGEYQWLNDGSVSWDISETIFKLPFIDFTVLKSEDQDFHAAIKKFSLGPEKEQAIKRAEKIQYHATYSNGVLDLANGFAIDKLSKYRGQMVELIIKVPVGKKIRFHESVLEKLNPVHVVIKKKSWRSGDLGVEIESDVEAFPWQVGKDYTMGETGILKAD